MKTKIKTKMLTMTLIIMSLVATAQTPVQMENTAPHSDGEYGGLIVYLIIYSSILSLIIIRLIWKKMKGK